MNNSHLNKDQWDTFTKLHVEFAQSHFV